PAASVHPEPGSNSSLYIFLFSWPSSICIELTLSIYFVRYLLLVLSFSLFNDLYSALLSGWAVKNPAHSLKRDCKGTHFF
ncbi:MAG: hypothetical protein IJ543_03190, partial [Bacteroidales bacterium]|nr:hypothetical protein [Bacteroidales bacterium]